MKIASWNINSIRARLSILLSWLQETSPDIVLLQETKVENHAFPTLEIEELGYNIACHGQKSYNGVAILSKFPIEDEKVHLMHDDAYGSRFLEAVTGGIRVASVYIPNGQAVGSDKFQMKLAFFKDLYEHLKERRRWDEPYIIGGDYNVAPTDSDVYDPVAWYEQTLCSKVERAAFRSLINLGYYNAIRTLYPPESSEGQSLYSWWDYRQGSWQKNQGLLIDHLLLSPQAIDHLESAGVDKHIRNLEKTSDHAPLWCCLKL